MVQKILSNYRALIAKFATYLVSWCLRKVHPCLISRISYHMVSSVGSDCIWMIKVTFRKFAERRNHKMTTLGLQYLQHTEQQRHNARVEEETKRNNLVMEQLTKSRDAETARSNWAREDETARANKASESLKDLDIKTRAKTATYQTNVNSQNVQSQIQSAEKQTIEKIAQADRQMETSAQTAKDTAGLNSLTNLFNTLVNAFTKSKKGK